MALKYSTGFKTLLYIFKSLFIHIPNNLSNSGSLGAGAYQLLQDENQGTPAALLVHHRVNTERRTTIHTHFHT